MKIPHELAIYGHVYRVRWAKRDHPGFTPGDTDAQVVHGPDEAKPGEEPWSITIDQKLRKDPDRAAEAFAHEVLHIFDRWEPEARAAMSPAELKRVTRWTWKRWRPLSHQMVHSLDVPLGRLLASVEFPCRCLPCLKKASR